jgi:hypothetical protein
MGASQSTGCGPEQQSDAGPGRQPDAGAATLSSIAPITPISILTVVNPSHDVSHLRYVGRSGPEEAIETIAESGQTIAVDRVIGHWPTRRSFTSPA